MYVGTHKLTENVSLMTEYQWRRADGFNDWQQSLLRFGLEYNFHSNFSLMAGYAWVKTFPYGEQPVPHEFDENRIFEQVNLKNKIGKIEVQHRYRLEQRFLEQYAKDASQNIVQLDPVFRQRMRYRAMLTIPLTRKDKVDHTLFLNLNNEVFLGFGKGIGKNILDQNRFISALGWRVNPNLNFQLGYLNQFVVKNDGLKMENNHTLWISTTFNVDFTKH
jgi:opacity protein-like surface antigen